MKKAIIYIHGKGGNTAEAEHYKPLFPEWDILGFDYKSETPWEAKKEFSEYFEKAAKEYDCVSLIAVSIGAFFAMQAENAGILQKAFFISPVVDMERLILDMMKASDVTENELCLKKTVATPFGETLSYEYLEYVRTHPLHFITETHILYAKGDALVSPDTVREFSKKSGATLTVMEKGEHWFHTKEEMAFLDRFIKDFS